jgi:hypothetical protein
LFEEINPNLQHFLMDVFKGYSLKGKRIHAIRSRINVKPDFYLHVDDIPKEVYASVKKGSGNSVHQESLTSFVDFLKTIGATNEVIDSLKLFHYGDGTTNNTGRIRLSATQFVKSNPDVVMAPNDFFSQQQVMDAMNQEVTEVQEGQILNETPDTSNQTGQGYTEMGKVYKDPSTGKLIMVQNVSS